MCCACVQRSRCDFNLLFTFNINYVDAYGHRICALRQSPAPACNTQCKVFQHIVHARSHMPNLLANFLRTHIREFAGCALPETIHETSNSFFHSRITWFSRGYFYSRYIISSIIRGWRAWFAISAAHKIHIHWWQLTCCNGIRKCNCLVREMHILWLLHTITLQNVTCSSCQTDSWSHILEQPWVYIDMRLLWHGFIWNQFADGDATNILSVRFDVQSVVCMGELRESGMRYKFSINNVVGHICEFFFFFFPPFTFQLQYYFFRHWGSLSG